MKPKQTNLSKYMNFAKKNKSIIPNFIDSSNKYPNYLQSSLKEDDLLLLKRKIKSYSKIHSHSSSNTNKIKKAAKSSHVSNILFNNYYLLKPKKINNLIDKSSKNQLMLTSVNNSSIIQSSKDKVHSYSINNISNYQSNQNNINNIWQKKIKKKSRLQKGGNNNNSIHKKNFVENEMYNQKKNFNNQMEYNIIKKNNKDKKYSLTSINSRKNSVDKEKDKDKDKEKGDIMKKLHKLNFNGLFNNKNFNNKLEYSSKNSSIINLNNNKKLYIDDFFNIKKKGKYVNKFLESYFKAPQSSNNRKIKKYLNNNSKNQHKSINNNNKNNQNSINNNTISKNNNNNYSSANCSPINNNKFFKTAKVSPRTSHPKKKQELQSHRLNMQTKISGNILDFYNNYKKNSKSGKNGLLYGNSFFIENNSNYINKTNSQMNKKKKKISMNLNINSNNHNNNNSYSKSNNKVIVNNNFPKCSSLNKIKKNNYVSNNNNAYKINNNSFINKKIINPNTINNKKYNIQNQNNSNIINNCQININNINYNQNFLQKNNHIINDKILNLFKKKNLIDLSNSKVNKIFSQSQQEIILIKKSENKNFTSNNSPINKNSKIIKIKSKDSDNSKENMRKSKLSDNKSGQIQKSKIKQYESSKSSREHLNKKNLNNEEDIKDGKGKEREKEKENNNKENKFNNSSKEINELKINLEKDLINKEKNVNDNLNESINKYINTISGMSSTTRDSNYYMEKCNSLSNYIKEYYNKYKRYPPTGLNFYLYGRLIGQGAFGKVNIGLNVLTGRVVAIKSFYKKDLSKNGENMRKILYETNLMKKLNHPNITKILEMFEDDNYILISMEYINGGNLFSFVKKRRKLSEKTAKFLFRQIILGIKHIHSNKIVHRDIKLENILIDLNNNIKICDFGIGRILSSNKQLLHDKCGTPMYMAPEILLSSKTEGYEGFPVDVWSSGISLYIMLSGTLPFNFKNNESSSIDEESNNNLELQYSIVNKEPKHIEKISDEARDLLKGLLNKNPNKRLTIDQILEHPWLKSDEKINNKKYHLFTKAEMIVLSKTYIDYRNAITDDLKENFTISNLKVDESGKKGEKKLKNISSKSSLLAPYNTLIQDGESIIEFDLDDSFDDLNNSNINLENDIIVINNKVKEFNLNYELNNNGECDNGMLINTKTGTISSSFNNKSESQLTSRSRQKNNEVEDIFVDDNDREDPEEEQEKKINKILDEIEKIGYDKEYVLNCVNKNILCHASTVFYLMLNYKNI